MTAQITTFGSWKSPITADDVFGLFVGLSSLQLDNNSLYWSEFRPDGRSVSGHWERGYISTLVSSNLNWQKRLSLCKLKTYKEKDEN